MANGKIIYTPRLTQAVQLDGAHYLSLDSALAGIANFGVADFALDALIYIDPAVADSECWIAAKGITDLASAAGFHWYYKPGSRRLGLRLNDGDVAATVVETADNQIPALGTWFWARVQADRNGEARFYVNGADVGGGSIAAAAGSLDNSEDFKVGGNTEALNRHQGAIDFLRLDLNRILPAAWHAAEWDRIRYGCRLFLRDFLALWLFATSLTSETDRLGDEYTLEWQGGGAESYDDGWPSLDAPLEYIFEENFNFGHEVEHLDLDDRQRTLSGSLFSYAGEDKRAFRLTFKYISPEQAAAFQAVWESRQPFLLHLDADLPATAEVMLMAPPLFTSVFSNRVSADLDLEET